jgi:hypothetical protein
MKDVGIPILWTFGLSYGHFIYFCHLVYFEVIWYIFTHFGILYQEKSGVSAFRPKRLYLQIRPQ